MPDGILPSFQIISRSEAKLKGLKKYPTGKPCKHGHKGYRWVSSSGCVTCIKLNGPITSQRYRHSEKGRAASRAADRKRTGTPLRKASAKRAITKHRQTDRGRATASAASRRHLQTPRGRITHKLTEARRRARKSNADGCFAAEDEQKLRDRQKKCHICGKRFTKTNPATLDHVIALANGGLHDAGNIALAHGSCNSQKRTKRTHLL